VIPLVEEQLVDEKLLDEPGRLAALRRYELLDTPPEAPFDRITMLVKTVLNVPMASVSLVDAERQWLMSCVGMERGDTPRDITFCTHTIQSRAPMIVFDASLDPRFARNPLVTGPPYIASYLGVPLSTPDGYNLGSLCAIDTRPRTFNEGQLEVLKSFAALVTDEIELRRIAQLDFLTGTATRRGFLLEAEKCISRFKRQQATTILLVFDIDHFKLVNDTYGHPAGDLVLRTICKTIEGELRTSDLLGRLGGEEFGILIAVPNLEAALHAGERFRQAIESCVIEHDPPIRVTASFGIAMLDQECRTADQWLAAADAALYNAKRSGRNKCCVAAPCAAPA
jgi:diguanylate cyclase (GGDEF)-like protein